MHHAERTSRQQALQWAKLAVRAYAKDPSAEHAEAVEAAWRRVRQIEASTGWRQATGSPSTSASDEPGLNESHDRGPG